jgi:hypothetical protein
MKHIKGKAPLLRAGLLISLIYSAFRRYPLKKMNVTIAKIGTSIPIDHTM